jgi:hypothetical protein
MHSNIIIFYTLSIDPCANGTVDNSGDCERCMVREYTNIHVDRLDHVKSNHQRGSAAQKTATRRRMSHLCCSHASPLQPHPPSCCTQQKNVTSVQDIETNAALHYLNRRSTNLLVPTDPRRGAKQKPPVHIKRTRRPFLAWRVEHTGTIM